MAQWYEKLFENYAKTYDKEGVVQGTIGECDFIEKELNFDKSLKIIDVGCGTGRHTIELTKRGYSVTGIDLSESQLKRAREKAKANNLLFPLFHSLNDFYESDDNGDNDKEGAQYKSKGFDLMTFRDHNITTFTDDDGREHQIECTERYYVSCEITWLLKSLGFKKTEIFGAKLGAFSIEDKLTTEDFEMLVIAEK